MGAVASHESHRKELYTVRVGANNKQEFGLVPLTCAYFPTPFTLPFRQLFDARHDGRTMYMYVNLDEAGKEIPFYAGSIEGFWTRNVVPCDAICKADSAALLDLLHCRCQTTSSPAEGETFPCNSSTAPCSRKYVRPVPCAIIELLDPNKASQQVDADKATEERIVAAIQDCQGLLRESADRGDEATRAEHQSRLASLRVEHHLHLMNKYFPLLEHFSDLDVYGNVSLHQLNRSASQQHGEFRYARVVGYLGVRNTLPNAEGNLTGGVFMSKRNNVARLPSLIALASYMYSRQMHLAASQHYRHAASAFSSISPSLSSSSSVIESLPPLSPTLLSNAVAASSGSLPPPLEADLHEFITSLAHDLVFDTNVTNVPMLKFITSLPQVLYFILQHEEDDVTCRRSSNSSGSRSGSASSEVPSPGSAPSSSLASAHCANYTPHTGPKLSPDTSTDSDAFSSATRETLSLMTPKHVAFSHSPGQRKLSCRFSRDLVNRIVLDAGALCSPKPHSCPQQRQPATRCLRHTEAVEGLFDIPNQLNEAMRSEFAMAMGAELSDDRWTCVGEDFGVWRGHTMRYGMVVSPKCLSSSNVMTDALPFIFERNRCVARQASLGNPQWKLLTASHGWWRVRVAVVHRGITPVEWSGDYSEPLDIVNRRNLNSADDGVAVGRVVEFLLDVGSDVIELHTAAFKEALASEVARAGDELRALPDGTSFQLRPLQWRFKGETIVVHIGVDRHCAGGFSRFDPQDDALELEVSTASAEGRPLAAPASIHCVFFNLNLVEQPQSSPLNHASPPPPPPPQSTGGNGRHQPYGAAVLPKSSDAQGRGKISRN